MGGVLLILACSKAMGKPITASSWAQWVPTALGYLLIKTGEVLAEHIVYHSRISLLQGPNSATKSSCRSGQFGFSCINITSSLGLDMPPLVV
jgi:hypothetical protein